MKFAWVGGFLPGGVHLGSVYLIDSVGLTDENLHILEVVAACVRQLRGPWILGGDWNVSPQVLAASNWLSMVGGTIVAPQAPTCNSSTYDYFVVQKSLMPAIVGIARLDDAGTSPHFPARLYLRSDARRKLVRHLARPEKVPGVLPHGPLPLCTPPPEVTPVQVTEDAINTAADAFFRCARAEWASLEGKPPDHTPPHFVWRPAVGPRAKKQAGEHAASSFWRSCARKFHEVAAILDRSIPAAPRSPPPTSSTCRRSCNAPGSKTVTCVPPPF